MGIKLIPFKISVPKSKHKIAKDTKRISNKIVKGKVFLENNIYKISIPMQDDSINPDLYVLEFTEKSYDLKDKITVFRRNTNIRLIRDKFNAKCMPGLPEQYVPFAPNWIVKGYIVMERGIKKFDFKGLVGTENYTLDVSNVEDY